MTEEKVVNTINFKTDLYSIDIDLEQGIFNFEGIFGPLDNFDEQISTTFEAFKNYIYPVSSEKVVKIILNTEGSFSKYFLILWYDMIEILDKDTSINHHIIIKPYQVEKWERDDYVLYIYNLGEDFLDAFENLNVDFYTSVKSSKKAGEGSLMQTIEQDIEKYILKEVKSINKMQRKYYKKEDFKNPKSFKEFDIQTVKTNFNLTEKEAKLFTNIQDISISDWLKKSLERAKHKSLNSEKERSEMLISPILTEVEEINNFSFKIFSGERLNIDSERGLTGELDFAFSKERTSRLEAPIFTLVEAKQADITKHWGQLVAQMVGVREENQNKNRALPCIFGCVTSGEQWRFAKLEDDCIYIDTQTYYLLQVEKILGIFQYIVDFYKD